MGIGRHAGNLDDIATFDELEALFGNNNDSSLLDDPDTQDPQICYFGGECGYGSVAGVGLGYVIYRGSSNSSPIELDPRVFKRIPELIGRFPRDLGAKGLLINTTERKVGIYSLNVYDT